MPPPIHRDRPAVHQVFSADHGLVRVVGRFGADRGFSTNGNLFLDCHLER